MDDSKLNIFVSHAGEDMELARTLQDAIERVCDPSNVDVFLDYDHISFGAPIPDTIKDALSKSHFFIGIATHNLRNQFSWCGLELGYFLSTGTEFQEICYLYHKDIQDVFRPYLGTRIVSLNDKHAKTLADSVVQVAGSEIYRLLVQIGIEASRRRFPKDPIKFFDSLQAAAEAGATAITNAYVEQLNRNAKQARYPQGRIKVTLAPGLSQTTLPGLIKNATVSIYPRTAVFLEIPGSSDESPAEMDWGSFDQRMRDLSGGPYLPSIMYDIIDAFLPKQYDAKNDYLFQTPKNHSFRVILVRYERYGDDRSEFVFNLIETLEPLKGGDPRTTLIASAIVMATQFRSLFIEHDATYSIGTLEASADLLVLAKEVARDLRRIHIESATLRISGDALKEALGSPALINDWHLKWWPPVTELETAAQAYIETQTDEKKLAFLSAHRAMIEQTGNINRQFTSLCLKVYKEIIDGGAD